jgi:hypothetical protein
MKYVALQETPMAAHLVSRLSNWKFSTACAYLEGQPPEVARTVEALAAMFGNCGWLEGSMGIVIAAALASLYDDDEVSQMPANPGPAT